MTPATLENAAAVAGISLTPNEREMAIEGVIAQRSDLKAIRALKIDSRVAPAMVFDPRPAGFIPPQTDSGAMRLSTAPDTSAYTSSGHDAIAFASVRELAQMISQREITSVELTKFFLARLRTLDPMLHCVVTYTEERALRQAASADDEIAAGRYRGPLHGIPWGAKDLLNVAGYPTTWGARGMEEQSFPDDATLVERLDRAGAVLVAKLSLGALAMGDVWFGGTTRNPWNLRQGASGSSAGSAAAVGAGCVPFALGSETFGSISAPSARCGVTGFRPTYGLVPRTGAMPLSWSMDKLGPIGRSVEDCAIVLQTIHGSDGIDPSVRADAHFSWQADFDWKQLRIGYTAAQFERADERDLDPRPADGDAAAMKAWLIDQAARATKQYDNRFDRAALEVVRQLGASLIPVILPDLPWNAMTRILDAEAAASFDELTRSGRANLLNGQSPDDWPNNFRVARFLSAVDYIQAQRARSLGIEAMAEIFKTVDVIVTPTGGSESRISNLTGYPSITFPNGVRGQDAPSPFSLDDADEANVGGPGTPVSLTLLGNLYRDAQLAAFARAYQERTGFHRVTPPSLA